MGLQPTRFTIDIIGPDVSLDGFTAGETWNGWDCPCFTFEQGQRIVAALNKAAEMEREHEPTSDTFSGYYDMGRDAFVFFYQSQKDSQNPEEDWDIFPAETIDGEKYYSIGAGCWIWEREDKWESNGHNEGANAA